MEPIKFRSNDNKKEIIILSKSVVAVSRFKALPNDMDEKHRDMYSYKYDVIINGKWERLHEYDLANALEGMKFVEEG